MRSAIAASFTLLFMLCLPHDSVAQQSTKSTPKTGNDKNSELQQTARHLLEAVIVELPEVEDLRARISMADTIVRLLGKSRADRCRHMLDSLFEAAQQFRKSDSRGADSMVQRIIQISAQVDPKLARSYVEKYKEETDNSASAAGAAGTHSRTAALYVKLASQLVEKDLPLALSMAKQSVSLAVVPETLLFIATLRKDNVVQANTVFGWALESVKRRKARDVNELLLLYSYVFSPLRVPVVSPRGLAILSLPNLPNSVNYVVDPILAKEYLSTTTNLLLDAERYYPGRVDHLTEGIAGDFYLSNLSLTVARTYLPSLTQSLLTQQNTLAGYLQGDTRAQASSSLERWNGMPVNVNLGAKETLLTMDYLLERAAEVSDQRRKDQLYYRAAVVAAGTKDAEVAFAIVEKISEPYRQEAQQFIAFDVALKSARSSGLEQSERLARIDNDLTRRAYILTIIVNSLIDQNRPERAMQLLNEVEQLAAKLDSASESAAVLGGAAAVASRLDAARSADLLRAAIRAANKVEGFTIDTRIARGLDIGGFLFAYTMYDKQFTFGEAIDHLGAIDFNQTIADVRSFKSRLPRLQSTVLLCNSVIVKTPASIQPAASNTPVQ